MASSFVPVLTNAKVFTRTPAQEIKLRRHGLLGQVFVMQPLWGIGSFVASQSPTIPKTSFDDGLHGVKFNNDWPCVYNTMTETWTQSDGNGGTKLTIYSPYVDVFRTITTVNNPSGGPFAGYGNIMVTGSTFSSNFATISYTLVPGVGTPPGATGVYTIQLNGSILNPSPTIGGPLFGQPFDPTDTTYGWGPLNDLALAILNQIAIPAPSGGDYLSSFVAWPISTAPGYAIVAASAGNGSIPLPYVITSGGQTYILCASCNGLPLIVETLAFTLPERDY